MNVDLDKFKSTIAKAREQIGRVIIGQEQVIDLALITVLTGNHALIEGVPGVAKTLLVKTLARVLAVDSGRIQFTPDLMPADITGTNIFNMKTQEFFLAKGPVFTTFLLADEINRAPAKTQAALLQAMQERIVTIDRDRHELDPGFTVFATQNPIEHEGTYPLPEAQKDRFMLNIAMGYPEEADETTLALRMLSGQTPESTLASDIVEAVLEPGELLEVRQALAKVLVREELVAYIVGIVRGSRSHESVLVGAGPRATQSLLLAARARAALDGRDYTTPDDVKAMSIPVLEHRLILRPEYEIEGLTIQEVITQLLQSIPVPR
ncbi:MoxR family ATPase [Rubellicoccus peritrichatus]|uniref:MoxR family ATPase n=1 Tax=Rubellicoccus peritrichatus TaxID=3080537 RepID=A0AAQ3LBE2_9BACT|nr:MoxR family ATPase [Puniceicoccus sp. CR14]WOO42177.1 MoxR family ATPase [Puniceicoccus sp. CR14]